MQKGEIMYNRNYRRGMSRKASGCTSCRKTRTASNKVARGMDSYDAIEFAKRWCSLGDAVSEQVEQIASQDPRDYAEVNPSAIKMAMRRLRGLHDELDMIFEDYAAWFYEEYGERF